MNDAEKKVSTFYNSVGWEIDGEITEDAKRWEDLREHSKNYVSNCRLRVLRHIPKTGINILDMASGPIQYKEYLEYSKNFSKRYCIDLSSNALEIAKKRIGDHGVFIPGSFFNIELQKDYFDCSISLHTIYHIDKSKQEEAVRKLLHITKPGKPVIIIYSNPNTLIKRIKRLVSVFKKIRKILKSSSKRNKQKKGKSLYFYAHPIKWWDRFNDEASIEVFPWRALDSNTQKTLIPDNKLGERMLSILFKAEERYPSFFVKHFQYPMIILTKK